ncbi:MAG TPA: histidine phosphatase family protein [Nocardioides sp.]|uniref:SixA phosphatase family protein n=1 Tax=Nocardioides sp. TaxID=35761 RepID=UPI002E31271B|nr:histidine phosphatase family protein [Nocardioides sp.]HEX5090259.1 histidine phosphatase family protein [Nocardioides sp.]
MRTLVVMRHSKAEQSGPSDFERELSDRGVVDATEAGQWLANRGIEPDQALVSTAVRAQQTWEAVNEGGGWDLEGTVDDTLYEAGTESALDLVRETDPAVQTLVVVGHNPTMASLATLLDDGEGDDEAGNEVAVGFPASALAVFSYDGDWADLDEASASVVAFHVGRG